MARGETLRHRRLKELSLAWAAACGWSCGATEVRIPRSGYRADVVASSESAEGPVILFECKQSRADFLKDAYPEAAGQLRLSALEQRLASLRELLAAHRPDLRCGDSLWPEFDRWDLDSMEHQTYRQLTRELACLKRQLQCGTKFSRLYRWRSADRLYLVLEEHLHAEAEIPAGWGLLIRRGQALTLLREAPNLRPSPSHQSALRRQLAGKLAGPQLPQPDQAEPDLLFGGLG